MQQVTNSCETFELSQVCIEDRSVVVEVCNAKLDEYFLVPKWIVNPNATCRNPRSDLLIPQSITFGENRSLPDWAPGTTQKALIETLSGVVSSDIGETLDVLSAFVWMSFLYPSFNELPILWLYSPSVSLRQLVKDVLRQLCFNGLEAKPYYLLSSVLFALKGHSVTLILNDPSEYPSSYRKAIFADRDRKECVYPFDANFTLPLFSPRIVVSHKGPDREYLGQCLAVPIRPNEHPAAPSKAHFEEIRTAILAKVVQCFSLDALGPERTTEANPFNSMFQPIHQISDVLRKVGEVDDIFTERLRAFMDQKTQERRTRQASLYSRDLLWGLWEFLQDPSHIPLQGGFFPFVTIAEYLRGSHEMFDRITPKLLSQELNKWPDLICDRKRMLARVSTSIQTVTCVSFDKDALDNYVR